MNLVRRISGLLLVALVPAIFSGFLHPKRAAWIKPDADNGIELAGTRQWGTDILWVDARPRTDFERAHIPGAVNLNEDEWEQLLDGFLDAWKRNFRVVVYCSSASCDASHEVAKRIKSETPITDVYVLKGGWESWQAAQKR